ncbi:type 2 periplasmic-binding domain-containing protein [Parenemella sanctibonifatiensis]|uniref:hypothetical protein n=1 Tax=Parenemella sanctibonifatiensis TaxID=2016505 RepID=UPI00118580A6|nr:hypothetical protein [Parenemella sanctibonifatiensis]
MSSPDIPGDGPVPDTFLNYPADPVTFFPEPLPEIEPISYLVQGNAPGVAMEQNSRYQGITEAIGANVEFIFGGIGDAYRSKFTTLIASGDLPDLMMMQSVSQMPQMLESQFVDLTDRLSGDGVTQYKGLASKPTESWNTPLLNGRLWGVPMPLIPAANIISYRPDLTESMGVPKPEFGDVEDFEDLLKELSRPQEGKFALGGDPSSWMVGIMQQMYKAPNGWSKEGDRFVSAYESEEYASAVESVKRMWSAGVFHPNSFSEPGNYNVWFKGGVVSVYTQNFSGWSYYAQNNPFPIDSMHPVSFDGSQYEGFQGGAGFGGYVGISKGASEERIDELLRVLDFMAAPFGSKEFLLNYYGQEGDNYEIDANGNPVGNKRAVDEYIAGFTYMGVPYAAQLYTPGMEDVTTAQADYLAKYQPHVKPSPITGLYSETAVSDGAPAGIKLTDAIRDIIQDRRPMASLADAVAEWKADAGDKIAEEYQAAEQAAG